eukprot:365983-Chlamydomonas_euryale.AAC.4
MGSGGWDAGVAATCFGSPVAAPLNPCEEEGMASAACALKKCGLPATFRMTAHRPCERAAAATVDAMPGSSPISLHSGAVVIEISDDDDPGTPTRQPAQGNTAGCAATACLQTCAPAGPLGRPDGADTQAASAPVAPSALDGLTPMAWFDRVVQSQEGRRSVRRSPLPAAVSCCSPRNVPVYTRMRVQLEQEQQDSADKKDVEDAAAAVACAVQEQSDFEALQARYGFSARRPGKCYTCGQEGHW